MVSCQALDSRLAQPCDYFIREWVVADAIPKKENPTRPTEAIESGFQSLDVPMGVGDHPNSHGAVFSGCVTDPPWTGIREPQASRRGVQGLPHASGRLLEIVLCHLVEQEEPDRIVQVTAKPGMLPHRPADEDHLTLYWLGWQLLGTWVVSQEVV
jgi:hypothetical protein